MEVLDSRRRLALIGELTGIARSLTTGRAEDDDDAMRRLDALTRGAVTAPSLPGIPGPGPSVEDARKETAIELFRYWQAHCDHGQAKPTPERLTAIAARLRDGYTPAEIRKAIDGAKHAAFVADGGRRFDDLTLICRNGSKLEDFIARGVRAGGPIVLDVKPSEGGVDEQIIALRRELATLSKQGRKTEYAQASERLSKLLAQRGQQR